jgi:hypothetical protein
VEDPSQVGERAAAYLRELAALWADADQARHNPLLRLVFATIELNDDRVSALGVHPAFVPFVRLACQASGTGSGSDGSWTGVRYRRAHDGRLALAPPARPAIAGQASPPQHRPRLAPDRWPLVATDARLLGLRQAAKQHDISHEAARQIMKRLERRAASAAQDAD